jgi:BirA family biotin operon repressor/biotin-[acetyl-CoA-carboxylase] ligase
VLPGFTVEVLPEVDSTNTELMRRARAGQTDPVLLVAERQTAGRGRLGRQWAASRCIADLFARACRWRRRLVRAVAGRGRGGGRSLHPHVRIKWPNDLWLQDRKLAGILIETAGTGSGGARYAVVGVGINITERDGRGPVHATGLAARAVARGGRTPGPGADRHRWCRPAGFEAHGFAPFQTASWRVTRARPHRGAQRRHRRARPMAWGRRRPAGAYFASGMKTITSSEVSVRPTGKEGA